MLWRDFQPFFFGCLGFLCKLGRILEFTTLLPGYTASSHNVMHYTWKRQKHEDYFSAFLSKDFHEKGEGCRFNLLSNFTSYMTFTFCALRTSILRRLSRNQANADVLN